MRQLLLRAAVAATLPASSVLAEPMVFMGDRLVGFGAWQRVTADPDPKDGCGPFVLPDFDLVMARRIQAEGCKVVPVEDSEVIEADKDPSDGCGRIPLGFLMPAAQEMVRGKGCASMLRPHPW